MHSLMVTLISSSLCKGDVYTSHFHYILADFHYTLLSFKMNLINCFIQLHTDCDEVMCARQFICSNSTYKLPHLFFTAEYCTLKTEESISDALSCCSMHAIQFSVHISHCSTHQLLQVFPDDVKGKGKFNCVIHDSFITLPSTVKKI